MEWLDDLLCKLPRATATWHCPWFRTVAAWAAIAAVAGLMDQSAAGTVVAFAGVFVLGLVVGERER